MYHSVDDRREEILIEEANYAAQRVRCLRQLPQPATCLRASALQDIMPLVVPSAENLFYCGEPIEDWIGVGLLRLKK